MDRLQEVERKHQQVRTLLEKTDALWLRRSRNIAWFTAGADATIPVSNEMGAYSLVITNEKRIVFGSNIECNRLRDEEPFEALGFEYQEFDWHSPQTPPFHHLISDEGDVETELQNWRTVLSQAEQERYRKLGADAAEAIEEAARAVQKGDTEYQIAARLDAACRQRGGVAIVNLVGTDERIFKYRHPIPTNKKLEKYALCVMCMRRGGLVVAASRLVHLGAIPPELTDKLHRVVAVDAAAIAASQPGTSLNEVLEKMQAAYAAQGETDQWKDHHQGGLIAYQPRERLALPQSTQKLQAGNALAWNPSVAGSKSEDTILVGNNTVEIVTRTAPHHWPMIEVDGFERPAILQL